MGLQDEASATQHQQIIAAEVNPERKMLYQLCWHLGASQGDIANLKGEDVDWTNSTVSFIRKKTGVPVLVHLGTEALNLFKDLPAEGVLFPYLSSVRANDRATEFRSRCRQLGINGITLHSYRYAWAERAKLAAIQSGSHRRHWVTTARPCIVPMRNAP
jgi:integrase